MEPNCCPQGRPRQPLVPEPNVSYQTYCRLFTKNMILILLVNILKPYKTPVAAAARVPGSVAVAALAPETVAPIHRMRMSWRFRHHLWCVVVPNHIFKHF
jgi:hypothetical protein